MTEDVSPLQTFAPDKDGTGAPAKTKVDVNAPRKRHRKPPSGARSLGGPKEITVGGLHPFIHGSTVVQAEIVAKFGSKRKKSVLARIHLLDGRLVMIFGPQDDEDLAWLATPEFVGQIFGRLTADHLHLFRALESLPQFTKEVWGETFTKGEPGEVWLSQSLSVVEEFVIGGTIQSAALAEAITCDSYDGENNPDAAK